MKKYFNILVITVLTFSFSPIKAQISWGGVTENQVFNFGFLFQGVTSEYKIVKAPGWNEQYIYTASDGAGTAGSSETRSLSSVRAVPTWGGALGFLASYNFSNHLSLRLTPAYVFSDKKVEYGFNLDRGSENGGDFKHDYSDPGFDEKGDGGLAYKTIKSTAVEFPLDFKIKSDRIGNVGAYILAGAKYTIDLGAQRDLKAKIDYTAGDTFPNNTIYTKSMFYSYAAGFGATYYFNFFKLSAEVKYNQSFNNINISDRNLWSKPIDKIYLRSINFSLIFE